MVALFIATPDPAEATDMDGRALSEHLSALDALARTVGVTPLSDLVGTDVIHEYGLEDDLHLPASAPHGTTWHPAEEGLRTIRALQRHAHTLPESVQADLHDAERVLVRLAERDQPFTLAYDL
ncbi:hypothetical protein [Deinococcus maricopensis]|uniref:Uncharacterized protein n=1 Tax=Deinococcus maricopensis (strain DSM 21211 / LMG 22137 / NRRL B-23946 / LB-34) TaxID=709986 RepID=E8UA14_DEIML|nr:hypothetical protein [Deinococcus maricopensis]ADV67903.1 hypothetical protein Deima_2265 [Deinococcus maricopensis DSM 21211]